MARKIPLNEEIASGGKAWQWRKKSFLSQSEWILKDDEDEMASLMLGWGTILRGNYNGEFRSRRMEIRLLNEEQLAHQIQLTLKPTIGEKKATYSICMDSSNQHHASDDMWMEWGSLRHNHHGMVTNVSLKLRNGREYSIELSRSDEEGKEYQFIDRNPGQNGKVLGVTWLAPEEASYFLLRGGFLPLTSEDADPEPVIIAMISYAMANTIENRGRTI